MAVIASLESIDLIGKRRDGGVDLVIVTRDAIDGSESTQKLIMQKIAHYLDFVESLDFDKDSDKGAKAK